jgi:hypothetical protein
MTGKRSKWLLYTALALALAFSLMAPTGPLRIVVASSIYRVTPDGTDATGCGSETLPCRTIQYAVDMTQSGDVIKVAAGTYTRSGTSALPDCHALSANANPVFCIVNKDLTILGGYSPDNWSQADPEANPTIIDGQNNSRGVSVIGWSTDHATASLVMEGFTIRRGVALGAASGEDWIIAGYGGGLYATNAPITLRHIVFDSNRAVGGNTSQTYGGTAAGGGLALNGMPVGTSCILEDITFSGNQALGGQGQDRGGTGIGGGLYIDTAYLEGTNLRFMGNIAHAGSSSGSGRDNVYNWTADGLGGGAAIHVETHATLKKVIALGNEAIGGDAGIQAGAGHGGAFYIEQSVLELEEAELRGNRARGGNGANGYVGGGGAIMTSESTMSLERSTIIENEAWGGNGSTGKAGAAGGGGLYLLRISSRSQTISISNSIIAGNLVVEGQGPTASGGGGGGVWMQGVNVDMTHTTIARNRLGETLGFGVGAIMVNFSCLRPTVANLRYTIVEGHPHAWGAALHVWQGNTLNLNRSLFAANSTNTNADGTITGLSTCQEDDSAGFVAPGSPYHDYHLSSSSPAIDQAVDSTTLVDIDGDGRPLDLAPDIGADEIVTIPLLLTVRRPESGNLALSWSLAPSLLAYLDHYELTVSAEAGASPPEQGGLGVAIDLGQQTTFLLTGLTDGKEYVVQLVARDAAGTVIAEATATATPMDFFHTFLPSVLGK